MSLENGEECEGLCWTLSIVVIKFNVVIYPLLHCCALHVRKDIHCIGFLDLGFLDLGFFVHCLWVLYIDTGSFVFVYFATYVLINMVVCVN